MRVLKICTNEWKNCSRDERELSVCNELGMETLVMAKGKPGDKYTPDIVDGFRVERFSSKPLGSGAPVILNRIAAVFLWARYAGTYNADIITGHNLSGVLIGWLSNLFKKHKAVLVYDSHEFEPGRNARRSRLQTRMIMEEEKFLIKRCAFTIIPCDSIADELVKLYHLKKRPVVIRSTPEYEALNESDVNDIKDQFYSFFDGSIRFIAMYHGAIMENRGIEHIIQAVSSLHDVGFVLLGEIHNKKYFHSLERMAEEFDVRGRMKYIPAVPHKELLKYVAAADVGMITIIPKVKSYYYALPNKLFENIQSLTPVIASDLPEMHRIISAYDIGILCDESNIQEITKAVVQLRDNRDLYDQYKKNLLKAKAELCWENEKKRLEREYKRIMEQI